MAWKYLITLPLESICIVEKCLPPYPQGERIHYLLPFLKGDNAIGEIKIGFSSHKGSTLEGKNLLLKEQILPFKSRPLY